MGVPAQRRRGAEKRERLVLAVPVGRDAAAGVEDAGMDSILHLEGRHDRAGGEDVELQAAARHVVDALGEVACELVEDILGGPGRLVFPGHVWARLTCGIAMAPAPARPATLRKLRRLARGLTVSDIVSSPLLLCPCRLDESLKRHCAAMVQSLSLLFATQECDLRLKSIRHSVRRRRRGTKRRTAFDCPLGNSSQRSMKIA